MISSTARWGTAPSARGQGIPAPAAPRCHTVSASKGLFMCGGHFHPVSFTRTANPAAARGRGARLVVRADSEDYYEVLGVARDADSKAIKSAYRQLARKFHPGGCWPCFSRLRSRRRSEEDSRFPFRCEQGARG